MMTQVENAEPLSNYFTIGSSKQFVKDIDKALRSLNLATIAKVLKKYKIDHLEDSQDFIGQLQHEFNSLKKDGFKIILLDNAKPRLSKCIGCSFGSAIKAFKYEYKKRYICGNRKTEYYDVVYESEFGVLLQIKNNVLSDLGMCNAFLTKEECDELKRC